MSDQESKSISSSYSLEALFTTFATDYSEAGTLVRLLEGDKGYDAALEMIAHDGNIDVGSFHDAYLYLVVLENIPRYVGVMCAYLGLHKEYRAAGGKEKRIEYYYKHGKENADSTEKSASKYVSTSWQEKLSKAVYSKWKLLKSLNLSSRVLNDLDQILSGLRKTLFVANDPSAPENISPPALDFNSAIYKRFKINPEDESPEFLDELAFLANEHWQHHISQNREEVIQNPYLSLIDEIDASDAVKAQWVKYAPLFMFIRDNRKRLLAQVKKDLQASSFVGGKRNGYGVRTHFSGDRYEGYWVDGHYQGEGVITYADGHSRKGVFEKGNITPPFCDIWTTEAGRVRKVIETLSVVGNRSQTKTSIYGKSKRSPQRVILCEMVDEKPEGEVKFIDLEDEYYYVIDYHAGKPIGGRHAVEAAVWLPLDETMMYNRINMNRQEFIERLEAMSLPKDQYIILSGGSLLLRGLRETTADFDLCASEELAKELDLYHAPEDDKGYHVPFDNVQMSDNFDDYDYDIVDGFQCETLESILEFKRRKRRPKDIKDIAAIEKYLAEHQQEPEE